MHAKVIREPARGSALVDRRLRVLVVVVALAIVFALGGLVASRFMVSPAQRDAMAEAPPPSVLTAPVVKQELADTVVTRGDVKVLAAVDVLAGRVFGAEPAVVTAAPIGAGDEAKAGGLLVEVNGRPVLALVGDLPAYEDLRPGATGPLVTQLQEALKQTGLKIDDTRGQFGKSTAAAVGALYEAAGYPAQDNLPRSEVAFLPSLPARVVTTTTARGKDASTASLVVAAGNPVVVVSTPDRQLQELARDGAPARLAHELAGEAAGGTLQTLTAGNPNASTEGGEAETSGTSETAGQETLVVTPAEPLPLAWIGANVRITITLKTSGGPTLTVPRAAVHLDAQGRSVVTVVDAKGGRDVEVNTGLSGDGFVEVTGELAEGDEVQVGIAS